jgi:hypothetical protein
VCRRAHRQPRASHAEQALALERTAEAGSLEATQGEQVKPDRSELLFKQRTRAAKPVLRRMLREIGVGMVLAHIRNIALERRHRLARMDPNHPELDQFETEQCLAAECATLLEWENSARWRPPKKRKGK